jgi:hypothetical protein
MQPVAEGTTQMIPIPTSTAGSNAAAQTLASLDQYRTGRRRTPDALRGTAGSVGKSENPATTSLESPLRPFRARK